MWSQRNPNQLLFTSLQQMWWQTNKQSGIPPTSFSWVIYGMFSIIFVQKSTSSNQYRETTYLVRVNEVAIVESLMNNFDKLWISQTCCQPQTYNIKSKGICHERLLQNRCHGMKITFVACHSVKIHILIAKHRNMNGIAAGAMTGSSGTHSVKNFWIQYTLISHSDAHWHL